MKKVLLLITCLLMVLVMAVGCGKDVKEPTEEEIIEAIKSQHQKVDSLTIEKNKLNDSKTKATVKGEFIEEQECADVINTFSMKLKYKDGEWVVDDFEIEEWEIDVHETPSEKEIESAAYEYVELKLEDGSKIRLNDTEVTLGESRWENTDLYTDITAVYEAKDSIYTFDIVVKMHYYDEYGEWAHLNFESSYTRESNIKIINVGIVSSDPVESGYRNANDFSMKQVFRQENGYAASFAYSLKVDEQISLAKKFIEDGVDYLLISPVDPAGWEDVLEDARADGIKVIIFDRRIDAPDSLYDASLLADIKKGGEKAVGWLKDQELEKYEIIHLQGMLGSEGQKGRTEALDEAVNEFGWTLVKQESADWDEANAAQIVRSAIREGKSFNVIYAESDYMARGAVAALDEAGITHGVGGDVIIISFNNNKWALEEVLNQNWNYEGINNPFQGPYIDDIIKKLENGERLNSKVIIMDEKCFDSAMITEDDVEQYGI